MNDSAPTPAAFSAPTAAIAPPPALWNPNAAALWSIVFTPIFGAWLHARNWQTLGDAPRAAAAWKWAAFNAVAFVAVAVLGMALPEAAWLDRASQMVSVALLLTWWLRPGREQVHWVKVRYGNGYPRRSFWPPVGWAVLALIGFVLAAGLLELLVQGILPGNTTGGGHPSGGRYL